MWVLQKLIKIPAGDAIAIGPEADDLILIPNNYYPLKLQSLATHTLGLIDTT